MHIRKYSHPEVDEDSHILLEEKLHQAVSPGKQKLPWDRPEGTRWESWSLMAKVTIHRVLNAQNHQNNHIIVIIDKKDMIDIIVIVKVIIGNKNSNSSENHYGNSYYST